jgi:hypothetical protein
VTRLGPLASATLAAGAAGALAVACGHSGSKSTTLPAAGSTQDDGSGFLARASVKFMTSTDEGGFEPEPQQQPYYGYDPYGYGYGGFTYGGFGGDWYGYGGSPYASYQAQPSYNSPNRTPDYSISYSTDTGSLEGRVTWPKPPKVPATVTGPSGCDAIDNELPLGSGNAIEGAVVYLEKIVSGRAVNYTPKPIAVGGTIESRDCAITPRVQVYGPVPGQLTMSNGEEVPRTLVMEKLDDSTSRVEHKLEAGGTKSLAVDRQGTFRVADSDGKLPAAFIMTAPHPYYALTDARGRYRLDDVVPGDYVLVAWFPPVVTGTADGGFTYSAATVSKKKVTVKKLTSTKADLAL